MKSEYRKGSEGAAQEKTENIFRISCTIVAIVLFFMTYFNLFGTYLHGYMQRASFGFKALGVVFFVLTGLTPWFFQKVVEKFDKDSRLHWIFFWFAGFAAAILFSAGFNFDLRGIE